MLGAALGLADGPRNNLVKLGNAVGWMKVIDLSKQYIEFMIIFKRNITTNWFWFTHVGMLTDCRESQPSNVSWRIFVRLVVRVTLLRTLLFLKADCVERKL